jgi:hypothetical protein
VTLPNDAKSVLLALMKLSRDGRNLVGGELLVGPTHLPARRINEAVQILCDNDCVKVRRATSTDPFDFATVELAATGRITARELESASAEQKQDSGELFSKRFGHAAPDAEITIREGAPEEMRYVVLDIAIENGLSPSELRSIVCRLLRKQPDSNNWSDYPNVWHEVRGLIAGCPWYRLYDVIERAYSELAKPAATAFGQPLRTGEKALKFEADVNQYFREAGVGWQLVNGKIQSRGSEAFEATVTRAVEVLGQTSRTTAKEEIHQALRDLSTRPQPDLTGAIQHSMAALECVARDVVGDPKPTLGQILKRVPTLLPPPLGDAVSKIWGFASERGRHLQERCPPPRNNSPPSDRRKTAPAGTPAVSTSIRRIQQRHGFPGGGG